MMAPIWVVPHKIVLISRFVGAQLKPVLGGFETRLQFIKSINSILGMTNTRARELIDSGYRMPAPDGTPDEVYQLMLRSVFLWMNCRIQKHWLSDIINVFDWQIFFKLRFSVFPFIQFFLTEIWHLKYVSIIYGGGLLI